MQADRVALTVGSVGLPSVLVMAFMTLRPNRLAAGTSISVAEASGLVMGAVIVGLYFAILLIAGARLRSEAKALISGAFACFVLLVTAYLGGGYAAEVAQNIGGPARVSLGSGGWVSATCCIVLVTNALQRSARLRPAATILAVTTLVALVVLFLSGHFDHLSLMREYANRRERFIRELWVHLSLASGAVGVAAAIGLPLGLAASRRRALDAPTFFILNNIQTVPSLALFGILIPLLSLLVKKAPVLASVGIQGIGWAPALIALTLYSLLPVVRNTYEGFRAVDPAALDAGRGMGMTQLQLLLRVEFPIASPILLNGLRIAFVQAIGLTAVAALIGAGGFGVFIFQGLGQAASDLILLGAVPTILIAVIADAAMNGLIAVIKPRGLA
jgi:osmoprotectant transport system permease protein